MFDKEEMKLIKGCLLTTKETFLHIPFKNKIVKERINQIDKLLEKFSEVS